MAQPKIKTLQDALDYIRPEAIELRDACLADKTTQNGYGSLLSALSKFDRNMQKLLLISLVENGYPKHTAESVSRILGIF